MKLRKFKNRIRSNQAKLRKKFIMKFVEVGSSLYPLNDRVIFKKDIWPNGDHWVLMNYTDRASEDIKIGDATGFKNLPFEKQVENILNGKIKEVRI